MAASNGKSKARSTKQEVIELHNAQVEKQQEHSDGAGPRAVKRPDLDNPYPASTKPIKELEKVGSVGCLPGRRYTARAASAHYTASADMAQIPLRSLELGKHHLGKALVVRTVAFPYSGVGTVTVVEDEDGDVERLVIFAHSDSSILSNIPEGCFVAVKEPFYRFPPTSATGAGTGVSPGIYPESNSPVISVDHPSDILLLRFSDPIIPLRLKGGVEHPLLSSLDEWKTAGDTSFLQGDLATAAFW
jgi:hypothetical protein